MTLPEPSFAHLLELTDDTGLFEHADHLLPRRDHGYTTDDAARALIAVCRRVDPEPALVRASITYAGFLDHAHRSNGSFHNRLSYGRWFTDLVGSEDSQGRALWALGTAARTASQPWLREVSAEHLRHTPDLPWRSPRANAFAVLGFVEALASDLAPPDMADLLQRVAHRLPRPSSGDWPWPEQRLAYDNARLPEALVAAGAALE
ncbi:MAG: glycosyltransferase, partial [Acidimicrobiia bacterium]|nr:glycosyltransferase [Acidimicrobiia bacterium]